MKQNRYILTALALPALVAFTSRGDEVSFHPAEGKKVAKKYENSTEVTLDDMTISVGGQEMDPSMFGMEMTTSTTMTIAVTDEFLAVSGDRPNKLRRSFDELSSTTSVAMSNQMTGDINQEQKGASELEGLTVVFTWNEDEGEYELAFDEDSSGDEELLEGLVENLDFRNLLPEGELSEGDSYEIEPEGLRAIFAPGGAVKITPEDMDDEEMMMGGGPQPSPDQMLGELEGEAKGEYAGMRDEDGVKVAVINIKMDISSSKDLTEFMQEMMEGVDGAEGMEMDIESLDMEFSFEGEGQLLWNVEAGLLYSLELSGDLEMIMDTAMSMSMAGESQAFEQSMSLSGTQSVSINFEL